MKILSEDLALFDMDGTLCDHDKALKRDMEKIKGPGEILPDNFFNTDKEYIKNRTDLIRKIPGWWENLEKFKLGFDILKITKRFNFRTHILTKGPSSKAKAWEEKVNWIRKNVPDAEITITEDKGLVYGKILVDDYPPYIKRWLEHRPRGLIIMPAHSYNKDFKHLNVMRYNGKNIREVTDAIKKVKLRKPKEHILFNNYI